MLDQSFFTLVSHCDTYLKDMYTEKQERNILEVFHHEEPGSKIDPIAREQTFVHEHEVWCARAKEFQGSQTIRRDDHLVVCLVCQHPTKPCGKSRIVLYEEKQLYGGRFIRRPFHPSI